MSPRLVYVAAPLAPWKAQGPDAAGYIVAIEQFEHVKRANKIARAALEAGYAPILIHNDVHAGVFGSDDVAADRERGIRACVATVEAVARAGGELWLLLLPDGTASHGCHTERAAFSRAGGRGIRTWRLVCFGADEHETPVCVGTVGIYGPNVVTSGRPEAARVGALPERFDSDYEEPESARVRGWSANTYEAGEIADRGALEAHRIAAAHPSNTNEKALRLAKSIVNTAEQVQGALATYPRVVKCAECDDPFTAMTALDRFCSELCAYDGRHT